MAMNKDVLGALIQEKMQAVGPPSNGESPPSYQLRVFKALADAIVQHITTDAVVNVSFVTAVSSGVDTSGPGTGTIS
jgi:hypothetical protein